MAQIQRTLLLLACLSAAVLTVTDGASSLPFDDRLDEKAASRMKNPPVKVASRRGLPPTVFKIFCSLIGNASMDPIVSPGKKSDHIHAFFGVNTVKTIVRVATDFRAWMPSTCNVREDKSMYWTPALYQRRKRAGNKYFSVPVKSQHYYFSTGKGDLYSMPVGLQLFTGTWPVSWTCQEVGTQAVKGWATQRPMWSPMGRACRRIQARVDFPSCWDGVRLSSSDQSHAAYPFKGGCSKTHPFRIPIVRSIYSWYPSTKEDFDLTFSNGDRTGTRMHADFVSGWAVNKLPGMLAKCVNGGGPGCLASAPNPSEIGPGASRLTFLRTPAAEPTQRLTDLPVRKHKSR